jgi:membrane protein involved in colicin uptake
VGARARYEQRVAAEKAAEAERVENAKREAAQREAARIEAARLAEENRLLREEATRRAAEAEADRKAAEKAHRESERAAQAELDRLSAELKKNQALMANPPVVEADSPFDEPSAERVAGYKEVIAFLDEYGFADAARLARIHFIA